MSEEQAPYGEQATESRGRFAVLTRRAFDEARGRTGIPDADEAKRLALEMSSQDGRERVVLMVVGLTRPASSGPNRKA